MKKLTIFLFLIFVFSGLKMVALGNENNKIVSDTLHVEGNCDMCKERIENAAYIKGVKKVVWNKNLHQLIVVYDASKTSKEAILKSVAEAGHDNEMFRAPDDIYNRLPKCCAYRGSGAHNH
jgi:periplasmic mercuric ion binding protein